MFENALISKQSNINSREIQPKKINSRPINTIRKIEYDLER